MAPAKRKESIANSFSKASHSKPNRKKNPAMNSRIQAPNLPGRSHPQSLHKNRCGIGKSQPKWPRPLRIDIS
eukprot:COSAG01_NODE_3499_length_6004_cov_2.645047_6_plen_72_part_00